MFQSYLLTRMEALLHGFGGSRASSEVRYDWIPRGKYSSPMECVGTAKKVLGQ